ncbi:MAG: hypothetical protein Q9183_007140 [Haloplaca sp. 2 TL-2023]
MYLLKDLNPDEQNQVENITDPPKSKFKTTWPKDFHVSPFNSRKGSYSLTAHNPFATDPNISTAIIDNTITLSSSKSHAKLVARIFSTQPSLDPSTLTSWSKLRFIASWFWVGFVTFPRIVREAGKLFFRRKLHVWFRPEVLRDSIGRQPTYYETVIERNFNEYLQSCVETSKSEFSVKYTSAVPSPSTIEETFTPTTKTSSTKEPIDFKITTPLFYTRLVRHAHISAFLAQEIIEDDDKNRTFHVSHPQRFLELFDVSDHTTSPPSSSPGRSRIERLRWGFLHWLRNHRPPLHQTQQQQPPCTRTSDIRSFNFSPLDLFAMNHASVDQTTQYRSVVTKILVSDMVAFGYPEVLDGVGWVLRAFLSWSFVVGVREVGSYATTRFFQWSFRDTMI